MAIKKFYLGSFGPFLFDDADLINDADGDFAGQYQSAMITDGDVGSYALTVDDPAALLADLSGQAAATFDLNSQDLAGVETIECVAIELGGTLITKSADEINAPKLLLE